MRRFRGGGGRATRGGRFEEGFEVSGFRRRDLCCGFVRKLVRNGKCCETLRKALRFADIMNAINDIVMSGGVPRVSL